MHLSFLMWFEQFDQPMATKERRTAHESCPRGSIYGRFTQMWLIYGTSNIPYMDPMVFECGNSHFFRWWPASPKFLGLARHEEKHYVVSWLKTYLPLPGSWFCNRKLLELSTFPLSTFYMFLVVSSNSQHPSSARTQEPPEMVYTECEVGCSSSLRSAYDIVWVNQGMVKIHLEIIVCIYVYAPMNQMYIYVSMYRSI